MSWNARGSVVQMVRWSGWFGWFDGRWSDPDDPIGKWPMQ